MVLAERCLEERSGRLYALLVVGQRGCKDHHMRVVGQDDALGPLGNVDAHLIHIGVDIGVVGFGRMAVRPHIGHQPVFEEALGMSIVSPLSDETCIVRHDGLLGILPSGEHHLAVAHIRGHQQMEPAIGLVGGEQQCVAPARETVQPVHLAKAEVDVVDGDALLRHQLCRIAVAVLEVGRGAELVEAEATAVEGKGEFACESGGGWVCRR